MKKVVIFFASLSITLLFTSCNLMQVNEPGYQSQAETLPLLNGQQKLGFIVGFNPSHPSTTEDSIDTRWNEALDTGMSVARLQIDWPELEPQREIYNKEALRVGLENFQSQGLQTFLLISAYDSEGPVVPDDLEGLAFNDEQLIDRFNKLMDWVIPMLVDYDGFLISISNEADNSFENGSNLHKEILAFLNGVKPRIHSIDSSMAVTVTFAEGSIDANKPGIVDILNACDVACWNYYGTKSVSDFPYYTVKTLDEIKQGIERLKNLTPGKEIVIQELGMHSGDKHSGSSEEIQNSFFQVFFPEMEKHQEIRAAFIFQLVDWSPEVLEYYGQLFENEPLPDRFAEVFLHSLETIGLIHYEDGKSKPAWYTFLEWLGRFD